MRARLIFIVVAIVLLAAFSALNWSEITRAAPLSFGVITSQAPLGLILLVVLGLTLAVFLISSATQEARYLMEHRRHAKALEAQRVLADTAEASRFTDLRQYLDTHLRENRQREAIADTEFEKAMVQSQRELRGELEQMNKTLAAWLGELDSRMVRSNPAVDVSARPADLPLRDRVKV
jgi:uncharacterized integral membrane protein